MGIHGLTSFIDNNPHLLKDHQLHDCRVVIDGSNLYHFLYYYCNVRFQFGGDYDTYLRKIKMIFNMFKSCNVEVFVVFDGAYAVDGRKLKTTMGRARDRVYASQRVMHGQNGTLIPCLARQTFTQALDELGIPHVTSDFEADNQLATLANLWNCPVISNDSDFYIFDLTGGYIPLDYIDFRPCHIPKESSKSEQSVTFLSVQYYHVDEFIKCFKSLNRSVLPLFATMLGNDYVDAAAFEAFYQKKTPKTASKRYSASKKHQKIVSVLYWLEEKAYKGATELVSQVLSFIRQERRQQVEKLLTDSISGYTDTQEFESFDLKRFLEGDRSAAKQKTEAVTDVTGQCLPSWFIAACRCGEVPVFLLNAALLKHVIQPIQVESISLPAACETSRSLREVIYGLLLGQEASPDDLKMHEDGDFVQSSVKLSPTSQDAVCCREGASGTQPGETGDSRSGSQVTTCERKAGAGCHANRSSKKADSVLEYTRHHKELRRIMVEPRCALPVVGHLPPLENIPSINQKDRQAILVETLGVSARFVGRFDPTLQLYMMCLVFWAKTAMPPVSLHHLKGILLSALLLHLHKETPSREDQAIQDYSSQDESATQNTSTCKRECQDSDGKDLYPLSIARVCRSVEDKVLRKVQDNLKKYYHDPVKISSKNPPDQPLFHGNAQFQACVLDAVHLNSLLCCPLPNPQPAAVFNGSFVHTIVHELTIRTNAELFLSEMLVKGSPLAAFFQSLSGEIVQEIGGGVLAEDISQGKKSCKGAKRRKKKDRASTAEAVQSTDNYSGSVEGHAVHKVVASCDLSNRFGALMVEDSF